MGSAAGEMAEETTAKARDIGRFLAEYDCALITGGCYGYPYDAVLGYKDAGGLLAVGISPANSRREHAEVMPVESFDLIVFTGFGYRGRNVVSVRSCDVVIGIGGRMGTLNELTIAYDEGKLIGLLEGSGGATDEFLELQRRFQKPGGRIIVDSDPERLVERLMNELGD